MQIPLIQYEAVNMELDPDERVPSKELGGLQEPLMSYQPHPACHGGPQKAGRASSFSRTWPAGCGWPSNRRVVLCPNEDINCLTSPSLATFFVHHQQQITSNQSHDYNIFNQSPQTT
jgi:hypothetical protein